jgi:alpha-L-fucosidase
MYVHVYAWPFRALHLDGYAGKVKYAQLLNDASELSMVDAAHLARWGVPEDTVVLGLPVQQPNVAVPVIELFLE